MLSWIVRNKNCYDDRSIKIMQLLLNHGADIKTKTSENKNLLHLFTIYDRYTKDPKCYRIGNFLVDKGVFINCINNYGEPLIIRIFDEIQGMTKNNEPILQQFFLVITKYFAKRAVIR
ncbi:MAG: hypothetical protein GY714_10090, partial [Desulfobacterales bacterium]|nr:hypothetical protein [Desulfobacterales bacterium]